MRSSNVLLAKSAASSHGNCKTPALALTLLIVYSVPIAFDQHFESPVRWRITFLFAHRLTVREQQFQGRLKPHFSLVSQL